MPNRGDFPLQPDKLEHSGRQSGPSTAPMPNARPWRRGQAPGPRSGAPKAQGWTATPAVAAQSFAPSVAAEHAVNSTGDIVPKQTSATPRFHTISTDTTVNTNEPCVESWLWLHSARGRKDRVAIRPADRATTMRSAPAKR